MKMLVSSSCGFPNLYLSFSSALVLWMRGEEKHPNGLRTLCQAEHTQLSWFLPSSFRTHPRMNLRAQGGVGNSTDCGWASSESLSTSLKWGPSPVVGVILRMCPSLGNLSFQFLGNRRR